MPRNDRDEHHHWEYHAGRHKYGFAGFLLVVGFFWLFKDMGLLPSLPFWPLVVIFFALFLILSKI